VKVAWLSYLDAGVFDGGGELQQRVLLDEGRRRGHAISESPFLRRRPQRAMRRARLLRGVSVDWDADLFVLANLRNGGPLTLEYPADAIERALASGRAAVFEDAWVDVCRFDMPCGGRPERCVPECERTWSRELYSRSEIAIFTTPMHRDMIVGVLGDDVVPHKRVLVGPLIDVDMFKQLGLERDIDVLYVGTIKEDKGYDALLERFGPERMTFVGPNYLGRDVEGTYLGPLPHDQLPQLFNRARTFAHLPRWNEPMGRTVVEAKLCGCDVVTNERVGATTLDPSDWTDPETIRRHPQRFWESIESMVTWAS
jgi:glycosyltransferase involved in cell wall biosynthesis